MRRTSNPLPGPQVDGEDRTRMPGAYEDPRAAAFALPPRGNGPNPSPALFVVPHDGTHGGINGSDANESMGRRRVSAGACGHLDAPGMRKLRSRGLSAGASGSAIGVVDPGR